MSRLPPPQADGKRRVDLDVHPDVLLESSRLVRAVARRVDIQPAEIAEVDVERRSIDARRGRVRVALRVAWRRRGEGEFGSEPAAAVPDLPALRGEPTVAIAGAGPAGMLCAWALARAGIRSTVFERGKPIRGRRRDLARLSRSGELDPDSNYCFGEGGAGTFSDGKLYTRASKRGPVRDVLELLVGLGAPSDILVDRRPHIGTNRLPRVVTALRAYLETAGVRFRFESRVDGLVQQGTRLSGVRLANGEVVPARALVVATGHSASDVWSWLRLAGVEIAAKPFAMGVRVEHPQSLIDTIQFGELAGHPVLGAASYRLVCPTPRGSVYSFCMCPGGYIVPAATHAGRQVVNGMSPSQRRGRYANSGLVAEVSLDVLRSAGLPAEDPESGIRYQEALERRAYLAGGGRFVAPAQRITDYLAGRPTTGALCTSYHRGVVPADLPEVLGELHPPIMAALRDLGQTMPGFVGPEAVAVGVESRTSAPVRVVRDPETLASPSVAGVYPCGEGAGYAGGIVSAALDGIRVATAIARGEATHASRGR
ncbi:MAG: FAD-binding protein [Myxococcales bacterium FL481]|nr:MAG: FAD-binding protein [Myxococcales bacterium FL481]